MPKEGAYRSSDISVKPLQSYQLSLEPGSTGGGVGQNPCVKSGQGPEQRMERELRIAGQWFPLQAGRS